MAPVQVKNSFSSIGAIDAGIPPTSLQLRLSITQTSVRYFVLSQTHQQVIFFGDYILHHVSNPEELVQRFERIVEKDEVLQLPFNKVLVGFNDKYTLVPAELLFLMNPNGQLTQRCDDTEIVFDNPIGLTASVNRAFSSATFTHLSSSLFSIQQIYRGQGNEQLFVNVGVNFFDIVVFSADGRLKLMNRYEYQTASDFIYFLLLCCEELKIDRDEVELVLLGEVNLQSKIYELCYRYFKTINFLVLSDGVQFSKAFDSFPKHLHFNLYNLNI
ncbi:MAG: DUF3822 family protein [Chitinophagales bacterium]|nr:DUF3822 family protein [Chitinophagales bacterium]